jgi:glycosyltransferase involved in cell wall biosynthesis
MKKILFMLTSMNIGGVEKSLLSLLAEMPKDKYEITVLLLEKKGGFLGYIPDWIKVEEASWYQTVKPIIMQPPQQTIKEYLKNKQYLKVLNFIFAYFISKYFNNRYLYYRSVTKNIPFLKNTYDVAISYQGPTDIIDFYIANKVKAKKKISWVHFDISKHKVNEKLYKRLYKKFNQIYVVSNEAKKRLDEQLPSAKYKIKVFMNLVPAALIRKMSKQAASFDETYKGIKIVTVGRLSEEKGQDIAIKVVSRLRNEGYRVRWYCIGDGNKRKEFEKLIDKYGVRNDFFLLGSTPNPYPYIKNSDIYVQTSRHEGYCLTLAEAKCLYKPIITTNFTGAYEQIQDGVNGLIVKCSEDELYKAVKELIENPIKREFFSNNLKKDTINIVDKEVKISTL